MLGRFAFLLLFLINCCSGRDINTRYSAWADGGTATEVAISASSDLVLTSVGGKVIKVAWTGTKALRDGAKVLAKFKVEVYPSSSSSSLSLCSGSFVARMLLPDDLSLAAGVSPIVLDCDVIKDEDDSASGEVVLTVIDGNGNGIKLEEYDEEREEAMEAPPRSPSASNLAHPIS